MNTQTDHSQLTFVNVLDEAGRNFHPKKSNDKFNSKIYYRTSADDVKNKTLMIYVGDYIAKKFGLKIGARASIVRVADQPYRIGLKLDSDGIKTTVWHKTSDKDEADQQGGYHDAQITITLDGLKVPHTEGRRIEPDHWEIVEHDNDNVLLIDLPEDQIYIDHIIETE